MVCTLRSRSPGKKAAAWGGNIQQGKVVARGAKKSKVNLHIIRRTNYHSDQMKSIMTVIEEIVDIVIVIVTVIVRVMMVWWKMLVNHIMIAQKNAVKTSLPSILRYVPSVQPFGPSTRKTQSTEHIIDVKLYWRKAIRIGTSTLLQWAVREQLC